MTAPDTRDSVERIVLEMRAHRVMGSRIAELDEWADRLAALPQPFIPNEKLAKAMERASQGGEDVAALQAEVARLRELLVGSRNVLNLLRSVVSAEGVRTFTHVESRSGSLVYVQSTIAAIDAAIGGTGDA